MKAFRQLSLPRQVMLVILVACTAALLVACGALFTFQLVTFRRGFERDLNALAQIMAGNSAAPLTVKDRAAALEALSALKATPHVVCASIQTADGVIFARYGEGDSPEELRQFPPDRGIRYVEGHLLQSEPILLDGQRIGRLLLKSDYHAVFARLLKLYAGLVALVLAGALSLAWILSSHLQRLVSRPILQLVDTARRVARDQDYSVRAEPAQGGELGILAAAFNQMLGQIQEHDGALRRMNLAELQREIAERKQAEEVAQRERDRVQQILDIAGVMLLVLDPQGRVVLLNQRGCTILGCRPEDMLGRDWFDVCVTAESRTKLREQFQRMIEGGVDGVYFFISPIVTQAGEERILQFHNTLIRDSAARIVGILSSGEDVTDRHRAEVALRQSEERYRRFLQNFQGIAYQIVARTGRVQFIHGLVEEITGHSPEDFLDGKVTWRQIVYPEDRPKVLAFAEKLATSPGPGATEAYRIVRQDGTIRWVNEVARTVPSDAGEHSLVQGSVHDVTARKQAEEALRAENSFRSAVIARATEGLCVCHQTAEPPYLAFTVWNDRMREITGYTMEEINRLGWYQTVYRDPETQRRAQERIDRMRGGDDLVGEEWEIVRVDGETRVLAISTAFINGAAGDPHVLALMQDVTERKRTEEARRLEEGRLETLVKLASMQNATINEITHFALEEGVRLTRSDLGYLAFTNEDESIVTMHAWSQSALKECAVREMQWVFPVEKMGLWGEALRQRRPIITNDFRAPHPAKRGMPTGHVPLDRHMNVPLFDGPRIVALVGVGNKADPYDEMDVRQLTLLMDGMWRLVQHKRAEQTQRAYVERVSRQHQALIALTQVTQDPAMCSEDLPAVLRAITEIAVRTLEVARVSLWLAGDQPTRLHCTDRVERATNRHTSGEVLDLEQYPRYRQALTGGRTIDAADALHDPRISELVADHLAPSGISSMLAKSILIAGKVRGAVCVEHVGEVRGWEADEVTFVSALADQVAQTLLSAERRRTLDQLRKLSYAIEQSPALIVITDAAGNIEYVNPRFTELTGYPLEEVRGKNPRILKSGQMNPAEYKRLWKTIVAGGEWRGEMLNRKRNGELYWESASISPMVDESGRITHFLAVKEDITERKKIEKQQAMMQMQLQQAQKLESIGRLAAGIAHEINTPTQYIGDNTRFLRDAFGDLSKLLGAYAKLRDAAGQDALTPGLLAEAETMAQAADLQYLLAEIPKAIDQSLEGVARVTKIVRAMKEFSHPGTEEKTAVDLNRAIESTVTVARNEWKYVADLVLELEPSLPPVPCLPGEFNQVILNLVINAAHAIGEVVEGSGGKGQIVVSSRRDGEWVEVRIRDNGPGIPEKIRGRMFEPFFTTKPVGKGTGQGLALTRSVIVGKHGGTIHFETEVGQGTTFVVRLPLNVSPAGAKSNGSQREAA